MPDRVLMQMIFEGLWDTIYMTLISTLFAYVIGLPMGVLLVITDKDGLTPFRIVNKVISVIVNLIRSVPFLILLITVIPLTRLIVGTSIGPEATVVPLVIAAAPFIARLVESSLKEVDRGVIEAAQSMGASNFTIVFRVLIKESIPSLILNAAIATTTILGYSAMAGMVGGGGLGDIAIRYGYHRYQNDVMIVAVILLIIVVQIIQEIGTRIALRSDKRKN